VKKVLFVGTNPSEKSKTNTAFEPGTKSMNTLLGWVEQAGISETGTKYWGNIYNQKTPNNRPLTKAEIKEGVQQLQGKIDWLQPTHIVALGQTASKALALYGIKHLELPHPSGLNRKLNDPKYVEETIQKLKEYYESEG
jgi:uracil-DNA glycosylase family 4